MGVNIGEVIVEGEDIFGDGVNLAARLEGIVQPGGIAISGSARDHVGNRLDLGFEDMGGEIEIDSQGANLERRQGNWSAPLRCRAAPKRSIASTSSSIKRLFG